MERGNKICYLNFNAICRLCLQKTDSLSLIFTTTIPVRVTSMTAVKMHKGDGLPELICQMCSEEVNRMHSFKTLCESSDATLRQCLATISGNIETVNSEPQPLLKEQDTNVGQKGLTKYRILLRKLDKPCASVSEDVITIQRPLNEPVFMEVLSMQANTKNSQVIRKNLRKPKVPPRTLQDQSIRKNLMKYKSLHELVQSCAPMNEEIVATSEYSNIDVSQHEEVVTTMQEPTCEPVFMEVLPTQANTKTKEIKIIKQVRKRKPKLHQKDQRIRQPTIKPPRTRQRDSLSTDDAPFACGTCSKKFFNRDNLKNHEICHTNSKPFSCQECGRNFAREQDLNIHMRYHSGDRPHECKVCKMRFHTCQGLSIHDSRHKGSKPHLCDMCGKTFAQKNQLRNHVRTHTQEKPYKCDRCDRSFNTGPNLKSHRKHHSGINEFCCNLCGKSFFSRKGLDRHELVHKGVKSFVCEVCKMSFFTKSEITVHMRGHNGDKRFSCEICEKSFVVNEHLKVHMRIHTGERPFACDLCKKAFYTKSKLTRHARIHPAIPQ